MIIVETMVMLCIVDKRHLELLFVCYRRELISTKSSSLKLC